MGSAERKRTDDGANETSAYFTVVKTLQLNANNKTEFFDINVPLNDVFKTLENPKVLHKVLVRLLFSSLSSYFSIFDLLSFVAYCQFMFDYCIFYSSSSCSSLVFFCALFMTTGTHTQKTF